jgi:hypothetical protein
MHNGFFKTEALRQEMLRYALLRRTDTIHLVCSLDIIASQPDPAKALWNQSGGNHIGWEIIQFQNIVSAVWEN